MKVGAFLVGCADPSFQPLELAVAAEERGFDSLYVGEHSNFPVATNSDHPLLDEVPEFYMRLPAPLISLAACAARTSKIRLGTSVALLGMRDAIHFAKETATLDVISGGRVELGIGYGWNVEEFANHGLDPKLRRKWTREKMLATRRLWEDDISEFAGELLTVKPTRSYPKPVQTPGPPVYLGGPPTPGVFRHAIEFCEGWMPAGGHGGISKGWAALHQQAEESGRDPATLSLVISGPRASFEICDHYRAIGAEQILLNVMGDTPDDMFRMLDEHVVLRDRLVS
jgi:probable F420-dependent oxidoreductase